MATISEKLFSREESLGGSHAEDLATLRGRQEIIADLAVLNRFRGIDGFKLRGLLDQTHRVLDAIRRQYQ